jgi:hypothetical protein
MAADQKTLLGSIEQIAKNMPRYMPKRYRKTKY